MINETDTMKLAKIN